MLVNLVLVGVGGLMGSVARYLVGVWTRSLTGDGGFPFGTLVVNVVGCLIIGFANGLAEHRQMLGPEARMFLMVGVLGGFTTFSAFGYETFALARGGQLLAAFSNILVTMALGLVAVWLGYKLTNGSVYVTDPGQASCTGLFFGAQRDWDPRALELFGLDASLLPGVAPTSAVAGETPRALLGAPVAVAARAGDQQSAAFAQGVHRPGEAKLTLGTAAIRIMRIMMGT